MRPDAPAYRLSFEAVRRDAPYRLKWIDRLALAVRVRDRIPTAELRTHVAAQLESARNVYRKLAEQSIAS